MSDTKRRLKRLLLAALLLQGVSLHAQAARQYSGWNAPAVSLGDVLSLFAATTPSGKRLGMVELMPLLLYGQMPASMGTWSRNYRLKVGVFLLAVRPEGTVAKVEMLQSTGQQALDGEVISDLKNWRFRPNSVTEVRVPAVYGWRTR
jgi:TonB family protein